MRGEDKQELERSVKTDMQYIDDHYRGGYCNKLLNSNLYSTQLKRYFLLLSLEDVLTFANDGGSITKYWLGNHATFKIGRNINPSLSTLVMYANRADISEFISKDIEDIAKVSGDMARNKMDAPNLKARINEINLSAKPPLATKTKEEAKLEIDRLANNGAYCYIYQMVMDENSDGAKELKIYINDLSKRASNKNIETLQNSLKELSNLQ